MKKGVYLITFLLLSLGSFAQNGQKLLGFNFGSAFPAGGKYDQYNQELPDIAYINGIYFDWNFSRQIGISVAADHQFSTQIRSNLCSICLENPDYRYYYSDLQVPINLTINLARKESATWKTYFLIGYTFHYPVRKWRKDLETREVENLNLNNYWFWNTTHFINAGFEVRHTFWESYALGISPFTKIQLSYETGLPFFGLNFKIGRIL